MTPFNERLAVVATRGFGTMWACYALVAFSLLPLVFPDQQAQLLYWSNCVQLVALPLLMVGQQVLGRAAERRATETHDAVLEELALLREERDQIAQLTNTTTKMEGA
ncbi:hypothetical protein ACFC1T_02260 [Kitasatospora sp. NPDC056076]|uniref:hypothetical protein n=1 Tax=Kitasatospora sp. NPDC056076 TaxID=3345703 RepID=UPI0035E194E1